MELSAIALWLNTVCAPLDEGIALAVHRLYEAAGWLFTPLAVLMSALGKWGLFLILTSLMLIYFKRTRRIGSAMLLGLAAGLLITNFLVKPIVARPRPYIYDGSILQQIWIDTGSHIEHDKSFPSGHMTAAMAASTAFFLAGNRKRSWLAFLFAIAMGWARIYLAIHYPTDVLGAVITGGLGGVIGYVLSGVVPKIWYELDFSNFLPGGQGKGRHLKK